MNRDLFAGIGLTVLFVVLACLVSISERVA